MTPDHVNTVIVGGGQAGLAMSAHLSEQGIDHLVIERDRIACLLYTSDAADE